MHRQQSWVVRIETINTIKQWNGTAYREEFVLGVALHLSQPSSRWS